MTRKKTGQSAAADTAKNAGAELRRRAEEIDRENIRQTPDMMEAHSPEAAWRLIHELRVHQIELELQNEELRRTQTELNISRERYFELYDFAPVGYFLLSEQGIILEANLTFAAILGMAKNSLLNQPFSRFVFREDQDIYYLYHKLIFEVAEPPACELRLVKSDGGQCWIQLEANSAKNIDGATIVRVMASDIAKRKQAEQALKSSQARYLALVDQSIEALALVDIQTREVVEVNRRFTELLGYSLPENAPLYVQQFAMDSDINLERILNTTQSQPRFLPSEARIFRHKNGIEVPVERTGTVISIDGRDYLMKSLRDMTVERRRKTDLIQDVEVAQRVQRALLPELHESHSVTIRTLYHPVNFVSGDSYLLEWCNDKTLLRGFLFDVSGHGLATALQTASVNVLLREATTAKLSLLGQMRRVNARAAKYFTEDAYAAMLGFELDLHLRELRYVGAGITQFYANGKKIETPGMFVGLWKNAEFTAGKIAVSEGDTFHFLTDGLTDGLAQSENAGLMSPGGKDFDADVSALERFAESGKLRDDATGVCIKVNALL